MTLHKVLVIIFTIFFLTCWLSVYWDEQTDRTGKTLFLLLVRTNWQCGTGLYNITEGKRITAKQSLSIYRGNLDKTQQNVELVRFFSIGSYHCILNINSNSLQLHQPFCFSLKYLWNVVYVSIAKNLLPSQINLFINCYNFRKTLRNFRGNPQIVLFPLARDVLKVMHRF